MNLALFKKSFHEAKWLMLGCALALVTIGWIWLWLVSQLDTSRFSSLMELLPGNLKRFAAVDIDWMITYVGRVSMMFDEPVVVMCLAVFCISRGSDCVSGELGRGTMELLLSQPISRMQLLMSNWVVTWIGIFLIVMSSWLGIYLGIISHSVTETFSLTWTLPIVDVEIPFPFAPTSEQVVPLSDRIDPMVFLPAILNFFCFGIFLAGLTTLFSSFDRYRWRTIGIVAALYVIAGILKMVGLASDSMSWVLWLSFFTPYEPEVFVALATQQPDAVWNLALYDSEGVFQRLGPMGNNLILLGLGVIAYVAAAITFCRRDLPAPH